jgi:hypothetical protein
MFNFSHEEFTDTKETGARGDFVSEGFTDGGTCKWHTCIIEFEKFTEIEELTLSCFGTEVAFFIPGGSNGGVKHQVELDRGFKKASGLWIADVLFDNDMTEFLARVIVDLIKT